MRRIRSDQCPETTGDGWYENCILAIEENWIEKIMQRGCCIVHKNTP